MSSELDTTLSHELQTIRNITNPTDQAKAAIKLVEWLRTRAMQEAAELRAAAVRRMYHDEGMTLRQIGEHLGLSVQRAQQIVAG